MCTDNHRNRKKEARLVHLVRKVRIVLKEKIFESSLQKIIVNIKNRTTKSKDDR
jgi:hypothetical protein